MLLTIWTILTGSMTFLTSFLWLYEKYKYVSARPRWLRFLFFRKSTIGKDIKLLVKKLAQIGEWMDNTERPRPLIDEIRYDIGDIEWKVWKETYSYFALRSKKETLIKLALRNLSQVQGKEAIIRAIKAIKEKRDDVIEEPSEEVKELIEAVLKELEELLQLEENNNLDN